MCNPFRVGDPISGIRPGVASHPGLSLLNPFGVGMDPAVLDGFARLSILVGAVSGSAGAEAFGTEA
jgi:hypothetical protein